MDVLEEVLEERREHIKQALLDLEDSDPILFYRAIAMPRLRHLAKVASEAAKTARTAAEAEIERQMMNAATDAAELELEELLHGRTNTTTPVAANG